MTHERMSTLRKIANFVLMDKNVVFISGFLDLDIQISWWFRIH